MTLFPTHVARFPLILVLPSVCEAPKIPRVSDDQRHGFQDQIPGTEDSGIVGSQ